jgi:hypothetical protein
MLPENRRISRRDALLLIGALAARPPVAFAAADPMQRAIPRTGEKLPALGLGTWQVLDVPSTGGDYKAATAAVQSFRASGGRVIDSSPMYGRADDLLHRPLPRFHGDHRAANPAVPPRPILRGFSSFAPQ